MTRKLILFTLGAVTSAAIYAQTGSSMLTWNPPTQYEDGTPLSIAEQRIYRSDNGGAMTQIEALIGPGFSSYVDDLLYNGDYCYQITAVDSAGTESLPSNQACKTVAVTGNVPRPNPPTNLTVQ